VVAGGAWSGKVAGVLQTVGWRASSRLGQGRVVVGSGRRRRQQLVRRVLEE